MSVPRSLENHIYGRMPDELPEMQVAVLEEGPADNGAVRRQLRVTLARNGKETSFSVLSYAPLTSGSCPAILSANLNGNHSVTDDPNVFMSTLPPRPLRIGVPEIPNVRGVFSNKFPIRKILAGGFSVVTFHHDEAEPDRVHEARWGVRTLYPELQNTEPGWGAVSAWAWCLSRVMDCINEFPGIDSRRVFLYGLSRTAKAALLAGASDARFAGVIADSSGKAGAALSSSGRGEPLSLMRRVFPHWFGTGFTAFSKNSELNAQDQDVLLSAIAPKPLLIAAGKSDFWSDPRGQGQAVEAAKRAYAEQPEAIRFLLRPDGHYPHTEAWDEYLQFLKTTR